MYINIDYQQALCVSGFVLAVFIVAAEQ